MSAESISACFGARLPRGVSGSTVPHNCERRLLYTQCPGLDDHLCGHQRSLWTSGPPPWEERFLGLGGSDPGPSRSPALVESGGQWEAEVRLRVCRAPAGHVRPLPSAALGLEREHVVAILCNGVSGPPSGPEACLREGSIAAQEASTRVPWARGSRGLSETGSGPCHSFEPGRRGPLQLSVQRHAFRQPAGRMEEPQIPRRELDCRSVMVPVASTRTLPLCPLPSRGLPALLPLSGQCPLSTRTPEPQPRGSSKPCSLSRVHAQGPPVLPPRPAP